MNQSAKLEFVGGRATAARADADRLVDANGGHAAAAAAVDFHVIVEDFVPDWPIKQRPVDFSIMTGVSHAALNLAALQALHPRSPQRFHSTPGCSRSLQAVNGFA